MTFPQLVREIVARRVPLYAARGAIAYATDRAEAETPAEVRAAVREYEGELVVLFTDEHLFADNGEANLADEPAALERFRRRAAELTAAHGVRPCVGAALAYFEAFGA